MDETTAGRGGEHGAGLDAATARAWREFQAGLGDRLTELADGDVLLVDVLVGDEPDGGAAPYVQFCAWGEGMLRGEVAGNHVLAPAHELGRAGERVLLELGYDAPTYGTDEEPDAGSLNFHVDLPQGQADRLAVMTVRALRDVFGVVHPALLSGDVVGAAPREGAAAERAQGEEEAAIFPQGGHEELTALVDAALTPYFGHPPVHDDDGDIPVYLGSTALFVRVCQAVPVIELFACVATGVQDTARATFEVNVLNRDVRHVKFRVVGDSVLADLQLPAWPFAPEQLRTMLAMMTSAVEEVAGDLQARVGGRPLLGDPEVDVEEHPGDDAARAEAAWSAQAGTRTGSPDRRAEPDDGSEMRRPRVATSERTIELIGELEAEAAGSVSPELAASVCDYDATRLLDLIRQEQRAQLEWRTLRDETASAATDGPAGVWDREIAASTRMVSLLRRALRVVVEREAAQVDAEPGRAGRGERRRAPHDGPARSSRQRRVPDPTIEEVDPDIWS
jgi:hypothetical protein